MGFKPDPQPAAGRFVPESPAAAGADDILGNARMKELSAGTAAPFKPLDVQKPDYADRVKDSVNRGGDIAMKNPLSVVPGIAEAGLNAATAGVSLVPGTIDTFLGRLGLTDPQNPTNDLQTAKNKYTYEPRTDYGKAASEELATAMSPVGDYVLGPISDYGGAAAKWLTGSEQVGNDVSASLPDLLGMALGARGKNAALDAKMPKPVVESGAVPEGKAKLAEIRKQGIKVTPKEASKITGDKNIFGRALQAIGGDAKISKDIAAKNTPVLNDMARKAVGAESITEKGLKPVKEAGNAVYTEMSSLGKVTPTPELTKAIESARETAGKSTKRNVDVDKFVDGVLAEFGGDVDASQIVNRVRELRRDASNNLIGEGDKRPTIQQESLGAAQRKVADALDDSLEYHAALSGQPELAAKYKENRVRLAKAGTVEGASRAGNVNAKTLYEQKQKGAPLQGKLEQIADAHEWAPESTAPNASETLLDAPGRNVDVMELPVMALQAAARHLGVNKFIQSDFYQNMIGGKAGGPHLAEHDPNPNAFPPRQAQPPAPPPAPVPPQAAPDFAGELGLAPDSSYQTLPGNIPAPVNGRSLADALGLQLVEDSTPAGVGPNALRNGPDEINFEALNPEDVGPYRINTDPKLSDARPLAGVQRGRAVSDSGDLELLPDSPQGPYQELPPSPGKPKQGGAPKQVAPKPAKAAPPAPEAPPEGLSELGAMIDEMLRTKRGQMENPAQQQQAQAPNFARELGVQSDAFPDRYMVPGSKRVSVSPDEGYLAYEPKEGRRQINDAFVKEDARGKGLGQKNLVKAAQEALDAGEALDSDVSVTPAQARAYLSAQKKGLIDFDITDQKAWDEALANGTNIKAGGQPVVKNIRPVTKQ
jgi:predicted GNAT family acetyltransferase